MGQKKKSNNRIVAKKRKEELARRKQWESENQSFLLRQRRAPYQKMILRSRGCNLPFYDFLDSHEHAFKMIVEEYMRSLPSLVGVHEVDDAGLASKNWERFGGTTDLKQIDLTFNGDETETYEKHDAKADNKGSAVAFRDGKGALRTLVRVFRSPRCSFQHKELKYVMKIPVLLHELGHVQDMEQGINFDFDKGVASIIDAEVYANRFMMEQCVKRGFRVSLVFWLDSYSKYVDGNDYRAEVARRTLDGAPSKDAIPDWQDYWGELTAEDLELIGENGRRVMTGEE